MDAQFEGFETILESKTLQLVCGPWKNLRELICLHDSDISTEAITGTGSNSYPGLVTLKSKSIFLVIAAI